MDNWLDCWEGSGAQLAVNSGQYKRIFHEKNARIFLHFSNAIF